MTVLIIIRRLTKKKKTIEDNDATYKRPPELFIDQWNNACRVNNPNEKCGQYNENTGYFELNEITDISYEEALEIYTISAGRTEEALDSVYNPRNTYTGCKCRTVFPFITNRPWTPLKNLYFYTNLEVIRITYRPTTIGYGNDYSVFGYSKKLRKILTEIHYFTDKYAFTQCFELEYLRIHVGRYGVDLKDCPKLSYDSVEFTVNNRVIDSTCPLEKAITITVHPTVYAKLTGDTSNEVVVSMSEEERLKWQGLIDKAVEKNITFVTV